VVLLTKYSVVVNKRLCKGCGICVDICPKRALVMDGVCSETGYRNPVLTGECIGCRICMWYCPDQAIVVVER